MFHEFARDVVLALEGVGDGPAAAEAHLAQGDFDAGRGALVEGGDGVAGPVGDVAGGGTRFGVEGGEDGVDGVGGEAAVDGGAEGPGEEHGLVVREAGGELVDGGVDDGVAGLERGVVLEDEFGETRSEGGERGGVQVVGGDAGVEDVGGGEALGGQGQVGADVAVEARQEEGAADVREEADCCFGHGEDGAFGGDAEGRVHREPDAAAHRDAVHERDVGFRVGRDQVVELVFEPEVVFGFLLARRPFSVELGEGGDVAARAEGSFARAGDDDDVGHLGLFPFLVGLGQLCVGLCGIDCYILEALG